MRSIQFIFVLLSVLFAQTLSAQYIQLIENRGEIGIMGGGSYYQGDIASDKIFYKPTIGAFYKKQLNDYVGLRLTYEYISLGANDLQSSNGYDVRRELRFSRVSHDVSIMGEFYFLKFINGYKQFRFTPYLGFGIGGWKSISGSFQAYDILTSKFKNRPAITNRTIVYPINLGFKYNVMGPWNVFGEITYRFTNSDKIDYFSDDQWYQLYPLGAAYQASTSGNDRYFTSKLGISYNLLKIYGPDKPKKPKKSLFSSKEQEQVKTIKNGLFGIFKRK